MASSRTGTSRSDRTRKASSSRVDWSAQCRSSRMSRTGCTAPSRLIRPSTSSSSCAGWTPSEAWPAAASGSSSGSSLARLRRAGPSSPASSAGGVLRASARRASTSGASGSPSAPSSMQWPMSTVNPASAACAASSPTSRVLPTPASPPISANAASPPRASRSEVASAAISSRRPTKTGLTTLALMTETLPQMAGRWRSAAAGNLREALCPGTSLRHAAAMPRGPCRPRTVRTTKRFNEHFPPAAICPAHAGQSHSPGPRTGRSPAAPGGG